MLESFSAQVQQRADSHTAEGDQAFGKVGTAGRSQTEEQETRCLGEMSAGCPAGKLASSQHCNLS